MLPIDLELRIELPDDEAEVRDVNTRAFPTEAEAGLVDALRGKTEPQISLVAENEAGVVGHILFTPVEIGASSGDTPETEPVIGTVMGLGPMAVLPQCQRLGIGSALVAAGLDACRAAGARVVVVLGHPDFYPRFGFRPAWDKGLYFDEPGPMPAFMVCELEEGALAGRSGKVRYHEAFYEL
ncbi:MAG: GNAT family N-acetyltransferase [Planctomycetota bacterium]|jgi:putative acetyltransferase